MRPYLPLVVTVLVPLSAALAGTTLYVPSPEYPAIQAAIDAAAPGDVVVLRDGVFQGAGNANLQLGAKELTLKSENGPAGCILDGSNEEPGITVADGSSAQVTIQGLTIRNAFLEQGDGAAIYCGTESRVNVFDCVITQCQVDESGRGGGICCVAGSDVNIRFCQIRNCRAGAYGGGVFCADGSKVQITGCTIRDNESYEADGFGGHGGGVGMRSATVVLADTDFLGNWAIGDGGAVTCDEDSDALIVRCRFLRNTASDRGGGVCFWNGGSPEMRDCIVADNLCWNSAGGGGIYSHQSSPTIDHCTIVSNRSAEATKGGGVYAVAPGSPTMISCIVWDNVGGSIFLENQSADAVTYSDVEGGLDGYGNINADPRFVGTGRPTVYVDSARAGDPLADGSEEHPYSTLQQVMGVEADMAVDYRLAFDSPCVSQGAEGDNMGVLQGMDGAAGPVAVTVRVAAGTYGLKGCSFQRHISLIGAGADVTILEGPQSGLRRAAAVHGLRTGALLKGVTVRASGAYGVKVDTQQAPAIEDCAITQNAGGGMDCSNCSPTIARCVISENSGYYGGGIRCRDSCRLTITDSTIRGNTASIGGGLAVENYGTAVIRSCTILENTATSQGGGVHCGWVSDATIVDSTIRDNVGGDTGGGLLTWNSGLVTVSNCSITGNSAQQGGGLAVTGASYGAVGRSEVVSCVIAGNRADSGSGGGVMCQGFAELALRNSLIAANSAAGSGAGLACMKSKPVELTNCTVAGNSAASRGGGLFSDCSQVSVANSILWGNTAGRGLAISLARSCNEAAEMVALAVIYSLVQGGQVGVDADPGCIQMWGSTTKDSDPLFVSPAGADGDPATCEDNDYRLRAGSPAIDAGNNDLAPIDSTDLDHDGRKTEIIPFDLAGGRRLVDDPATPDVPGAGPPTVDMGAYEDFLKVAADFDADGDVDGDDLDIFHACITGPALGPIAAGCSDKDLDRDGDVDQSDFGLFQRCYSGPNKPADSNCAN